MQTTQMHPGRGKFQHELDRAAWPLLPAPGAGGGDAQSAGAAPADWAVQKRGRCRRMTPKQEQPSPRKEPSRCAIITPTTPEATPCACPSEDYCAGLQRNLRRPKKDRRPDRPPSPLPPLVAPDRRVGRHPLSTTNCLTICADFSRFCRLLSIAIEKPAAKRCQEFFN